MCTHTNPSSQTFSHDTPNSDTQIHTYTFSLDTCLNTCTPFLQTCRRLYTHIYFSQSLAWTPGVPSPLRGVGTDWAFLVLGRLYPGLEIKQGVFGRLATQWVEELEWAQEGKVYRLKTGKAQLLIASMMTSTPMMLSMNPARAWYAENQCE